MGTEAVAEALAEAHRLFNELERYWRKGGEDLAGAESPFAAWAREHDAPQPVVSELLPLYGTIPAGVPETAEQADETFEVLKHLVKPGRYVLRVEGDSMTPAIAPGDLVLMEHVSGGELGEYEGKICAVLLNGESTLKRVQIEKRKDRTIMRLRADNKDHPDVLAFDGEDEISIQGVAIRLVDREL